MWKHTDSNRGPSACKADALNQLSYASILFKLPTYLSRPLTKKPLNVAFAHLWCPEQESNLHSLARTRF